MSMIFQFGSEPITSDALLTEDKVMDSWLYDSVIDCFHPACNDADSLRDDLLPLLLGKNDALAGLVTIGYGSNNHMMSFTLHEGYHAAYFAEIYQLIQQKFDDVVSKISFDQFLNGNLVSEMSELKTIADNEFGDYVCFDNVYIGFDEFIRNAVIDKPYYIAVGGSMYYK